MQSGPPRAKSVLSDLQLLVGLTIFCLVPFAGKPLHVDDPLFVWTAKQIVKHPLDFYGFDLNWYGFQYPMAFTAKNPPLAAYYLALVGSVTGFRETLLHLGFLLPNFALVCGMYFLARKFCERPLLAVAIAAFTPATMVSATSLMCDTMMLALWCWAIICWLDGLQGQRFGLLLLAGFLAGLAGLTKYFGAALIPLLAAQAIATRRRPGWWLVALALPAGMLVGYDLYTARLYGRPLLLDASLYANYYKDTAYQLTVGAMFLGGCLVTTLFYTPLLWSWWPVAAGAAIAAIVTVVAASGDQLLGLELSEKNGSLYYAPVHLAVYALAVVNILTLIAAELWRWRDLKSVLLLLWTAGTLVFAFLINWTINARSLLPLAPVLGILIARRIELRHQRWIDQYPPRLAWIVLPALVVSLAATWGDHCLARSAKTAAEMLVARLGPLSSPLWFEGHWGFQYYMEQLGAVPLDRGESALAEGAYVIIPRNNSNLFLLPDDAWKQVDTLKVQASRWVTTISPLVGANFYAALEDEPFPLLFAPVPPERYHVFHLMKPVNLKRKLNIIDPGKALQ
jgi:4-amino-4-deoxy-L-arabinose transferase-like glycosyltransferase